MPESVDELAKRLDAIEHTVGERIDRLDSVLKELRQATDGGFGKLERRLIQLVQGLVATRQAPRGRNSAG